MSLMRRRGLPPSAAAPAAALGTDRHGYGLDGKLCAFVVSRRLTPADIIRSQTRSEPWATAFAPRLIIPQHYSDAGLGDVPSVLSEGPAPPYSWHTHTQKEKKITQATRGTKQGRGSSKQALETFQTKEKSAEIWSRRSFYLGCHYS